MDENYRKNHYIPIWYQKQFILISSKDAELYCLDRRPDVIKIPGGPIFKAKELKKGGPKHLFYQQDLYTRRQESDALTDIEQKFFGEIDRAGSRAVKSFANFAHNSGFGKHFQDFIAYLSAQKLRTPKGIAWLRTKTKGYSRDQILETMVEYNRIFCAIWTECIWQIADAKNSPTKFIFSDHPVTIYNRTYGPNCDICKGYNDPDIRQHGSHTIFPLSSEKILILTNLSWVRNPYQCAKKYRPNPNFFRDALFNMLEIQTERLLDETEVRQINFIIKSRSYRFVAAGEKEWLYPEQFVSKSDWARFGHGYLLMPDPRCVSRSNGVLIGFKGGGSTGFDEYGRRPGERGYIRTDARTDWRNFDKFQGQYARLFGPRRRGRTYEFGKLGPEEDAAWIHQAHLQQEIKPKKDKG